MPPRLPGRVGQNLLLMQILALRLLDSRALTSVRRFAWLTLIYARWQTSAYARIRAQPAPELLHGP